MFDSSPNTMRILVVDDDPAILRMVGDKLDYAGFEVLSATSGEHALEVISRQGLPHLAIVDLKMAGMSGIELCQTIHQMADLPVIILTAVAEEETIIESIEKYAEDYVTKPFSPRELVARVQRILRRMGSFEYTFVPQTPVDQRLSIDFAHQKAIAGGKTVPLTPTETKLLYILMRNAGRTVTTDFLLRRLWPLEEVFEDTLRVHIHRLRQKIEANPSKPRYVVTKRGLGYVFFPQIKSAA